MLESPNQTDLFIPLQAALKGRYWLERELGRMPKHRHQEFLKFMNKVVRAK